MEKVQGAACAAGVETLPAAMGLERQPGRSRRDTLNKSEDNLNPCLTKYQMEWESGALLVKLGRLTSTHSVNIPCWS